MSWQAFLELAIGAEDMQILIQEGTAAVWEQLRLSKSFLALHRTRPLMNFVLFLQPLDSVFYLPMRLHLFLPFNTSWGQSKLALTASVASSCDTTFALQLGGKCHFAS